MTKIIRVFFRVIKFFLQITVASLAIFLYIFIIKELFTTFLEGLLSPYEFLNLDNIKTFTTVVLTFVGAFVTFKLGIANIYDFMEEMKWYNLLSIMAILLGIIFMGFAILKHNYYAKKLH